MQITYILKAPLRASLALIALMCFAFFMTGPPAPSYAQNYGSEEEIPNEFIFQVTYPPVWQIAEALFAYETRGKYYLPIRELSEGFDFLVEIETGRRYAEGFAGNEDNSFTLDFERGEMIVKGEKRTLSNDEVLVSDFLATDDLYIQLEVLNEIWPVDMRIDLPSLKVISSSEEVLPFVARKEREAKQNKVEGARKAREERRKLLPPREFETPLLGKPVIDYQAIYTYDTEEDDLTGSNIFNGVQQIAGFLAEFSATFALNEDGELDRPDSARLRFSKKSAGEEYLVKGVRSVEFGDVNLRQRDLIGSTESGRGVVVSNNNNNVFNEFSNITLEGTGPPGWDIEIFNNEELIDFGVVPDDGQFFFEDIVLNFGNNQIRILLFGPQGQVREEIRNFDAGGSQLPPGEFLYNAGLLDADREFLLFDNAPRTSPRGVVQNLSGSYGVNNWLTVFGNYAQVPDVNNPARQYATAGGIISTPAGLIEAELYNEVNGGNAAAIDYITDIRGIRANIGVAVLNDFESQDAGFGSILKDFETTAQLNKTVRAFGVPIGLRLNTVHTEFTEGPSRSTIDTAQTFSRSGIRFSHTTNTQLDDGAHLSTSGGLTTTVREGPWQLRGSASYDIHPVFDFTSFSSELRYRPEEEKYQAALTLAHNFDTQIYDIGAQFGYDFDTVLGTLESNYSRGSGWELIVRATSSFGPFAPDGSYNFDSRQRREISPVQANIFLDKNADGIFNGDDEPIEDAGLSIGPGSNRARTDENGLLVANAQPDRRVNIQVDKSTLVDPYYVPVASSGFSAVPQRGSIIKADFPVVETGSVEGTVYRTDNDSLVSGLTLELYNENDEQITDPIVTAFDGYYAFEFVEPGTYTIKAEPSHGVILLDNTFTISPDDLYVFGNDLYIDIPQVALNAANTPGTAQETFGPFTPENDPTSAPPAVPVPDVNAPEPVYEETINEAENTAPETPAIEMAPPPPEQNISQNIEEDSAIADVEPAAGDEELSFTKNEETSTGGLYSLLKKPKILNHE